MSTRRTLPPHSSNMANILVTHTSELEFHPLTLGGGKGGRHLRQASAQLADGLLLQRVAHDDNHGWVEGTRHDEGRHGWLRGEFDKRRDIGVNPPPQVKNDHSADGTNVQMKAHPPFFLHGKGAKPLR